MKNLRSSLLFILLSGFVLSIGSFAAVAHAQTAAPTPAPVVIPSIVSLHLINTDTQQAIPSFDPLLTGATINLATLLSPNINITVTTQPAILAGSVLFNYDGNPQYHVENYAPYSIGGDTNTSNPLFDAWTPTVGSHTLTITPYTLINGGGTAGKPYTIKFTVTNTPLTDAADLIQESTATTQINTYLTSVKALQKLPYEDLTYRIYYSVVDKTIKVGIKNNGAVNATTVSTILKNLGIDSTKYTLSYYSVP